MALGCSSTLLLRSHKSMRRESPNSASQGTGSVLQTFPSGERTPTVFYLCPVVEITRSQSAVDAERKVRKYLVDSQGQIGVARVMDLNYSNVTKASVSQAVCDVNDRFYWVKYRETGIFKGRLSRATSGSEAGSEAFQQRFGCELVTLVFFILPDLNGKSSCNSALNRSARPSSGRSTAAQDFVEYP
jgi:hypothetical protein